LNRSLEQVRAEKISNPKRNDWIAEIVSEIARVSKIIAPDPSVAIRKPELPNRREHFTDLAGKFRKAADALRVDRAPDIDVAPVVVPVCKAEGCVLLDGHDGPHCRVQ
jgi:hypothetical protein